MEGRIRELEIKLNNLITAISTSKWWAAIIGALILGFLGLTSFYTIPNQIANAFSEQGIKELNTSMKGYVADAKKDSEAIGQMKKEANLFEAVSLFRCPATADVSGKIGAWASFGCNGQISTQATCQNYVWTNNRLEAVPHECQPITLYRKK